MPKVFICYRREDSIDTAGRIYSWLSMRLPEGDVFFDVHGINPGANFRDAIEKVLVDDAAVVLVIIGKSWTNRLDAQADARRRLDEEGDQVRREIEIALEHQSPLIPVLVQGASIPKKDELPPSIAALVDINALSVRPEPDFDDDMRRLRTAIQHQSASVRFHPPVVTTTSAGVAQTILATLWSRFFSKRRGG